MAGRYRIIARSLLLAASFSAFTLTLQAAESQPADPATLSAPVTPQDPASKENPTTPTVAPVPAAATITPEQAVMQNSLFKIPGTKAAKIGYADMFRIYEESSSGKAAKSSLKVKTDKFQSQLTAKQKQLEKQKTALEAKLPTLPQDQKVAKVKEFEKKVEEYRKFAQNAEKELKPLQEELTRSITKEIEMAAENYGKANGFSAIIVRKELLYLGSGVEAEDVTDALLKLMK